MAATLWTLDAQMTAKKSTWTICGRHGPVGGDLTGGLSIGRFPSVCQRYCTGKGSRLFSLCVCVGGGGEGVRVGGGKG